MEIAFITHLQIEMEDGEYIEQEVEVIVNFDYSSLYNEFEINSITHNGYDVENETIYEKAEEEIRDYLSIDYREAA